jgi:hypothetical protein
MRTLLVAGLALCLVSAAAAIQTPAPAPGDLDKLGPQVGQRAPDFSLADQRGSARTLASILGPNGALLVFFRSAEW